MFRYLLKRTLAIPRFYSTATKLIVIDPKDIDEKHIRGWGNGGQKLNKTSSCVQLHHRPTNTNIICQETRSLQQNKKIAYKRLKDKLDFLVNGEESKVAKKISKLQAKKRQQKRRAKKKYQGDGE